MNLNKDFLEKYNDLMNEDVESALNFSLNCLNESISNKDIWRDSKKYCIICENECIGDGIQIINNFICNKCIERMNLIDVGSDEYEIIKNKIKNSIADKIIKNK